MKFREISNWNPINVLDSTRFISTKSIRSIIRLKILTISKRSMLFYRIGADIIKGILYMKERRKFSTIQDAINCWRLDPTNEIGFYNFSTNWCRHVFEILILLRGIRRGEDFTHREEEERRQERKKRRCWKSFRNSCKIYIPLPRETTISSKVFEHSWRRLDERN